jgi:hypothetical protein
VSPDLLRLRAVAAALTAVILCFGVFGARTALAASPGVVPDLTWGISRADMDRTISMMKSAGVKWVRLNVSWNAGEAARKGAYNGGFFADMDYAVSKTRAAGIQILVSVADGVPYWASGDPNKSTAANGAKDWRVYYRPTRFSDYADFLQYVVNRYKGMGVRAYQVWNEPNLTYYWPSGANPAHYTAMLKTAYPAVKAADPNATVVLGGLSGGDWRFLAGVYDSGGRPYFDVAGIHPYAWGDPTKCWTDSSGHKARDTFCSLEEIRQLMVARGDAAKKIWATEFGWSTCDNAFAGCLSSGVTEAQQADYTTKAFNILDARYPWVEIALVYQFRNLAPLRDTRTQWKAQLGLVTTGFTPKPLYHAFQRYAQSQP